MLSLYHASDLDTLSLVALNVFALPQDEVFATEQVVVPSQGMGRWLTLQIAQAHGIAMQLDLQLPSSFIWSLARTVLGSLPEQSAFNPDNLTWRLYDWLAEPAHLHSVPRLARYLKGCDERRRLSLAARIADVFDQYLLYRDDWLAAWERQELLDLGPDEEWQALLWYELTRDGHPHRARVLETVLDRLSSDRPIAGLPKRLLVFGVSSLPVHHLRVFERLARHTEVSILALSPTREFWGDIRDWREVRQDQNLSPDDWYLNLGNPLLASLGKQGRDFFDGLFELVSACNGEELGLYAEEALVDTNLLTALQNDVLKLRTRLPEERISFDPNDRSLEVHVAHSALREVEILHEQLLARFRADPDLTPDQVVVLTPDIEVYAPFIEAVFAPRPSSKQIFIPYSLADRGLRSELPLIESFLQLLALPDSRFSAEELLTWLHQPAMAKRAGIEADDLPLIRHWLQEAGIRWGRDAAHRARLGLPPEAAFSWQQGLDRLLLGFAAPPQLARNHEPLLGAHWPLDALEGARAQLLGRLVSFVEQLGALADQLAQPRSLKDWAEVLQRLLETLFDEQEAGETLVYLSQACGALREQADISQLHRAIPLELVRQQLTHKLEGRSGTTGFLTGMVTFCTMVPMRSLPFKVICLLGLNDGRFPRRTPAAGFDLIARYPRRGDRTRRLDDRYLLLEALLSARQALYLSYVGQSPRDNTPLPPSVLISELLEVVDLTAVWPEGSEQAVSQKVLHKHPLQPFAPRNFEQASSSQGFSSVWFQAAQALVTPSVSPNPFARALAEPDHALVLEPEHFIRALRHPARFFLERRLGLRLPETQDSIVSEEPFELDGITKHHLLDLCLAAQEHHWAPEAEYALAQSAGWLPTGALGKAHWGQVRAAMLEFAPRLLAARPVETPISVRVEGCIEGVALAGWLTAVTRQGRFQWKLTPPSDWDRTAFWLRHLLLNWVASSDIWAQSTLMTPDETWQLAPMPSAEAEALLLPWAHACREAFTEPLPVFTRSSYAFAKAIHADKSDALTTARSRAQASWMGSEQWVGECYDPWNGLAFRDQDALDARFEYWAKRLLLPLLQHF